MKKVIAVVVTYNRKELLVEAINALKSIDYVNLEILVIDNASTDGTKEYINDLVDNIKIKYFNTGSNLGGAGGFNYGIKKAVEIGCDYIWIMDDDCIVRKDSLNPLLEKAKQLNDDFGYLSSNVKWIDGSQCKMNLQRTSFKKGNLNYNEDFKITLASFVSLFINIKTIIELGLPIKDFFIWGDDWEYTYRISNKYDCYYVANSIVDHKCAKNIGCSIVNDDARLNRYFYEYRNEYYFYKHAGLKGRLYYFLKIIYHRFKIIFTHCKNKKEKLSIIRKGLKAGRKFNPKIEYVYPKDYKVKVLEFFGEPLAFGGQEAFMLNMYENFSKDNIYTLATPFELANNKLVEISKKRNETIIHCDFNFNSKYRKKYIKKSLNTILKNNKYDVIHIQSGSIFTLLECAKIAKKYNIKKVIVHSHCCGNNNLKYRLIKKYSDKHINKYVDEYFACSLAAGEWKFPKQIIDNNKLLVIKNGIITKDYLFDNNIRKEIRNKLNIEEDQITFVHVGRFSTMKNHEFFLKLLPLINDKYPNFKFVFVGAGELKQKFINDVNELNLSNHIIYLENIDYVNKVLMAGDIFLFPSLFEGFPMTLVEAQCSGLITIFSDLITNECILTDNISQLPLDENKWKEEINRQLDNKLNKCDRTAYVSKIIDKGYDASYSAKLLEKIYRGYKYE